MATVTPSQPGNEAPSSKCVFHIASIGSKDTLPGKPSLSVGPRLMLSTQT